MVEPVVGPPLRCCADFLDRRHIVTRRRPRSGYASTSHHAEPHACRYRAFVWRRDQRGIGFAVGKKGRAPRGSSVTFALSGPLARDVHVAVGDPAHPERGGRAAVVPTLPGPPTVTLGLDSRLFTRLCGGRVSPADRIDEITFAGDEALGRQIATNLAFTI